MLASNNFFLRVTPRFYFIPSPSFPSPQQKESLSFQIKHQYRNPLKTGFAGLGLIYTPISSIPPSPSQNPYSKVPFFSFL